MILDVSPLKNALATLKEALNAQEKQPNDTFIRDACIQRFEYCFELSHKFLRRYLKETEATPSEISDLDFSGLIRLGYERGLLALEWVEWKIFRNARNITSHGYDEAKAKTIVESIPKFLAEAEFLLGKIQKRQGK